jgi:thymidylate kinase
MGISPEASNVALPMTRLIAYLRKARRMTSGATQSTMHPGIEEQRKTVGKLRATARLANRLAEEWYRQLVSWSYRHRGNIVIYERHFKFDFEYDDKNAQRRFTDRVHRWCLARLYPGPDLVIFLDAPAEVLFARKGEASLEWLDARRQAFLRQGAMTPRFVRVDATQPFETVYAEVCRRILEFRDGHEKKSSALAHVHD